jgi:hypothetical protein
MRGVSISGVNEHDLTVALRRRVRQAIAVSGVAGRAEMGRAHLRDRAPATWLKTLLHASLNRCRSIDGQDVLWELGRAVMGTAAAFGGLRGGTLWLLQLCRAPHAWGRGWIGWIRTYV